MVFGAGGDRDAGKRGPMGEVAAKGAEIVLVTDDNPRSEDPADIRGAIVRGAAAAGDVNTVPAKHGAVREIAGRREAIAAAIGDAGSADIVLVAGKGHEQGQITGSGDTMRILPFDDVAVARECAASKGTNR